MGCGGKQRRNKDKNPGVHPSIVTAALDKFAADLYPTRREILRLLRRQEMTAGELAERFDMTKPTMSHHFAVLKEADLITSRREGQTIWYGLNTSVLEDVIAWALPGLPAKNPVHGNFAGEVDRYGSPGKLFIVGPVMMLGMVGSPRATPGVTIPRSRYQGITARCDEGRLDVASTG